MNPNTSTDQQPAGCAVWLVKSHQAGIRRLDIEPPPETLDHASQLVPAGVYTTFCTFQGGSLLCLDDHLARLETSARLAGWPPTEFNPPQRELVLRLVRKALDLFGPGDLRFRLTLDLSLQPGDLYLAAVRFEPLSSSVFEHGVAAATASGGRTSPQVKTTAFIQTGGQLRSERQSEAFEVLFVSGEGEILEGTSSNFYGVLDGEIWTAYEGVLPGITRSLVLDEANRAGLIIHSKGIDQSSADRINEAFLTSSTRGIVPVVHLDDLVIGEGRPGPVTRLLMERYRRRVDQELEPVPPSSSLE